MGRAGKETSGGSPAEYLIGISQELSLARSLEDVTRITRKAAREICGADGATMILRDGDLCHYVDEDAIGPLWKGLKFPLKACVSGWSILNGDSHVIEDIYKHPEVPHDAYRPTFVKSMVMVPIRESQPLGAIGNYWSKPYKATPEQVLLLRSLANLSAIALENVKLIANLKTANRALESSIQARDEFLSLASHELKTPLSSLKLQLELLERRLSPDHEHFEVSHRQVESLNFLIENLLDVSRIQTNRLELELTAFDFSEAIRETTEAFSTQLENARCDTTLELASGLNGEWDRKRIGRMTQNLLSNACKYAPGAPVRVATEKKPGLVVLTVEDHGPGIRAENQERIFERFERGTPGTHVSGLGLGLFITRKLVEAHHGRISLNSTAGQGTRFTLELPNA